MVSKKLLATTLIALAVGVSVIILTNRKTAEPTTNASTNTVQTMHQNLITLSSPAFEHQGTIPSKYSCDGENIHPPLAWTGTVPPLAKSFVLIMEDPDVPESIRADRMFDHWIVFNMPKNTTRIDEGATPPGILGANTRGNAAYTGPCPPDGEHRYFFKLFMLDTQLDLETGATKAEVVDAMQGHVLAQGELIGRFQRE